jgi:hypothetical protein
MTLHEGGSTKFAIKHLVPQLSPIPMIPFFNILNSYLWSIYDVYYLRPKINLLLHCLKSNYFKFDQIYKKKSVL